MLRCLAFSPTEPIVVSFEVLPENFPEGTFAACAARAFERDGYGREQPFGQP